MHIIQSRMEQTGRILFPCNGLSALDFLSIKLPLGGKVLQVAGNIWESSTIEAHNGEWDVANLRSTQQLQQPLSEQLCEQLLSF